MSLVNRLSEKHLISPPKWLPSNVCYEAMTGSVSYGVSDVGSDVDIVGFCIPPKELVFPHLSGEINGFGRQKKRFDQYQQHGIKAEKEYDVTIYSIVRFFDLVMGGNPNMVDSLFVPQNCVITSSIIADMVRTKRTIFLSKKCFHTFKGYAFAQLHKIRTKNPEGKRKDLVEKYGYDTKYAYHLVRLLSQCQQILEDCDLDLQEKGRREHMKAVRNGEMKYEDIVAWFNEKEKTLEKVYHESKLRHSPNEEEIKQLLLDCLESHYGSLSKVIEMPDKYKNVVTQIQDLLINI